MKVEESRLRRLKMLRSSKPLWKHPTHSLVVLISLAGASALNSSCGSSFSTKNASVWSKNHDETNNNSPSPFDRSCTGSEKEQQLRAAQKAFTRLVAGSCVILTVMKGLPEHRQTAFAQSYLRQFTTTCTPWPEDENILALNTDILQAPEIGNLVEERTVACASPAHAVFEDVAADKDPARLQWTRVMLATLSGFAQFHPDQKLALPSKYLHRYLTGIGGVKIISEQVLVSELEKAVLNRWMANPQNSGSVLIGYTDYAALAQQEQVAFHSGSQSYPAITNTLGRALVRYQYLGDASELQKIPRQARKTIENYDEMVSAARSDATLSSQPSGYLLAEVNDPYSWPGYDTNRAHTSYAQETDGSRSSKEVGITTRNNEAESGAKASAALAEYPGNTFPNALLSVLRFLLDDRDELFVQVAPRSSEAPNSFADDFSLKLIGNMKDSTMRALLGAGARDFQMARKWIIPVQHQPQGWPSDDSP